MAVEEQEIRSGTVEELAETVSDAEKREAVHNVRSAGDALFTWDYERSRDALSKLYEKAKTSMWNVSTDIDWDIDVDPWKIARDPNNPLNTTMALERAGTPATVMFWLATAPIPARANEQRAPTAGEEDDTATPNMPVFAQRATTEKVMLHSFNHQPAAVGRSQPEVARRSRENAKERLSSPLLRIS